MSDDIDKEKEMMAQQLSELKAEFEKLKKEHLEALAAWAASNKMYNKQVAGLKEQVAFLTTQKDEMLAYAAEARW